jgi:WD40 repeat protein
MSTGSAVPPTTAQRRSALEAFARALRREEHNLHQRPDLLWQQLYNRLQWEDEPLPQVLAPELDRRSAPGAAPWLRTRTRLRESEALIRTLTGHTRMVLACAISPDCSFVVSASSDKTLKVWDAATGKERVTLTGHTDTVLACAISPDCSFIVSASDDKTLKIWDAATGKERVTLTGHTGTVRTCAISPDCSFVVSASSDKTLKVWDAATGKERVTLTGHTDTVLACAISPDCSFIVSASNDKTLKIWDAATGKERVTLVLLGARLCVAIHPRLPFTFCGDAGGNVYFIDPVGIAYEPIIVTAADFGHGPKVRCPACFEQFPSEKSWLGQTIDCPRPGCKGRMRVNPFVTVVRSHAGPGRRRWQFWRRK